MAGLLFWSSLSATLPTLPVYIAATGASNLQIGLIMGSFAIGMFVFRPQCGMLADRRGRKIVLLIGMSAGGNSPPTLFQYEINDYLGIDSGISWHQYCWFCDGIHSISSRFSPSKSPG